MAIAASGFLKDLFASFCRLRQFALLKKGTGDGQQTFKISIQSLGILFRILLPMSVSALGALVIFIFLFTWNEFFWSLICLQRSKMLTLPIGLKTIMGARNVQYGILFGASLLSMIPSLVVFLLLRRHIIKGIAIGGVIK